MLDAISDAASSFGSGFLDIVNDVGGWIEENPNGAKLLGSAALGVGGYYASKELADKEYNRDKELLKMETDQQKELIDYQQGIADERAKWGSLSDGSTFGFSNIQLAPATKRSTGVLDSMKNG